MRENHYANPCPNENFTTFSSYKIKHNASYFSKMSLQTEAYDIQS